MAEDKNNLNAKTGHSVEVGDTGVPKSGETFSNEILSALTGANGTKTFQKMAIGDSEIGMLLRMIKAPIQSCDWEIISYSDDTNHKEQQEFLENYFFEGDGLIPSWTKVLAQILSIIQYGFNIFEVVWTPWIYDGKTFQMPNFHTRVQTSIKEIQVDNRIVIQKNSEGDDIELSFDYLTFFILDQEGNDYRGNSLIRNAYKDWIKKEEAELIDSVGIRKMALGIPTMKIPKRIKKSSQIYKDLQTNMKAIGKSANPYMIYPDEYIFEIIEGKYNGDVVDKKIKRHNLQMAKSVLVQFLELGMSDTGGSYNLADIQTQVFLDSLGYIIKLIEEPLNQILKDIIRVNFGEQNGYATIKGANVNKSKVQKSIDNIQKMLQVSAIQLTQRDENSIRTKIELPQLTEEEMNERSKEKDLQKNQNESPIEKAEEINKNLENEIQNMASKKAFEYFKNTHKALIPLENYEPEKVFKLAETNEGKPFAERVRKYWKLRKETVTDEVPRIKEFMQGNLILIKDKLLLDIEKILNTGAVSTRGLKNVELSFVNKYADNLKKKMAFITKQGYDFAKQDAKGHINNLKLAELKDINPKVLPVELQTYVVNKAETIIEAQTVEMRVQAVLTVQKNIDRGLTIKQSVSEANKKISKFINGNAINAAANNIVNDSLSTGQGYFTNGISTELQGHKFVNFSPVTAICRSLNGHYYAINSPESSLVQTPLHFGCNSFLVPIYKDEKTIKIDNFIPGKSIWQTKTI